MRGLAAAYARTGFRRFFQVSQHGAATDAARLKDLTTHLDGLDARAQHAVLQLMRSSEARELPPPPSEAEEAYRRHNSSLPRLEGQCVYGKVLLNPDASSNTALFLAPGRLILCLWQVKSCSYVHKSEFRADTADLRAVAGCLQIIKVERRFVWVDVGIKGYTRIGRKELNSSQLVASRGGGGPRVSRTDFRIGDILTFFIEDLETPFGDIMLRPSKSPGS